MMLEVIWHTQLCGFYKGLTGQSSNNQTRVADHRRSWLEQLAAGALQDNELRRRFFYINSSAMSASIASRLASSHISVFYQTSSGYIG